MQTSEDRRENLITLEPGYVLRANLHDEGLAGEVIMLDYTAPKRGTRLFAVPTQPNIERLIERSRQALNAYREG